MDNKVFGPLTFGLTDDDFKMYEILSCEKDVKSVVIPARVDGFPVVGICDEAFEGCSELEFVTFEEPDDEMIRNDTVLKTIGEFAFAECKKLRTISIPEYVQTVGWGAFRSCESLMMAEYSTRTYLGIYAFANCKALFKVSKTDSLSEGLFSGCESLPESPILDGTESIDESCFENCAGLVNVTIPASVKCIEPLAFSGCENLKNVIFENPQGWYYESDYSDGKMELELSDSEANAEVLATMDFDDGIRGWWRE